MRLRILPEKEKEVPVPTPAYEVARARQLRELLDGVNRMLNSATAALGSFRAEHMAFAGRGLVFVSDSVSTRQGLEVELRKLTRERDEIIIQRNTILAELAALTVK